MELDRLPARGEHRFQVQGDSELGVLGMSSSSGADDLFGQGWGVAPSPSSAASTELPAGSIGSPEPNRLGFGEPPAAAFDVVHPPLVWLSSAVGVAAVALALGIVFWGVIPIAIVAWVLGGPVTIGLTAVFQSIDTDRRTQLGYSSGRAGLAAVLYVAALALGLGAVAVAAVDLALWAGRGF
jgi:hypothetical protein